MYYGTGFDFTDSFIFDFAYASIQLTPTAGYSLTVGSLTYTVEMQVFYAPEFNIAYSTDGFLTRTFLNPPVPSGSSFQTYTVDINQTLSPDQSIAFRFYAAGAEDIMMGGGGATLSFGNELGNYNMQISGAVQPADIPEPPTAALLWLSLGALAYARKASARMSTWQEPALPSNLQVAEHPAKAVF
jgi:hypothetical protein